MAYGIFSQDFLAICLYMVKGDISRSLLDLIETVESFQKEHDSYYGTIDSDFRMVLLYICLEIDLIKEFPVEIEDFQILDTIQLKEIVLPVLTKHYAYFTDSEACWVPFEEGSKRLKNYEEMTRFFSSGVEKKPDEVRAFLERSSWSPSIMAECLAHGGYIDTTWDNSVDWDNFLECPVSDTVTGPPNPPHFLLIGCGGAGIRILDQILTVQSDTIKTVAIDSDEESLGKSSAEIKIFLENNPITFIDERDVARSAEAILEVKSEIESLVEPSSFVFIVAGLGRGVGSGASPQIAKIARDRGALVIATPILPFLIQDKTVRQGYAAVKELFQHADSVIVFDNQRIRDTSGFLSVAQDTYEKLNGIIVEILGGIIRSMTTPSRINLDPEDFDAIFRNKGLAIVLYGEPPDDAKNTNERVVKECWGNQLFDVDYRKATGSIVLFAGGYDINGYDAEEIALSVTDELDTHAEVVWCTDSFEKMGEKMKVYVIMTGIRVKG